MTDKGLLMNHQAIKHAVAMVLLATGIASAQYRVDRSGANDANNRIGSGGRNLVSEQPKAWQFANDVVTGNITGGKQFRGNIASRDPFAFRGQTASGNSDRFIRDSSGVSTSGVASYNANQTNSYYGDSRAAPPPAGLIQIPGSGGYVPPRPSNWRTVDQRISTVSGNTNYVMRPDLYGGAGPIDLQYAPDAVAVPAVIQSRQLDALGISDYTPLNRNLGSQLTPQQLQQLQGELTTPRNLNTDTTTPTPNGLQGQLITKPTDDSLSDATKPVQLNRAIDPNQSPELGVRNRLVTAAEQSGTYAQLLGRRSEQEKTRLGQSNEQAAQQYNSDVRKAAEAAEKKQAEDQPTPTGNDAGTTLTPRTQGDNPAGPAAGNAGVGNAGAGNAVAPKPVGPLRVDTLADDKKSGLNEIMKQAEAQMREGKYATAIDTYESAETLAPNNPLIKLGRTHAELGGGYYRRAEVSLRQTLSRDKNLLAGQYDLRTFLGEERLQTIERDLRELIQKNEKDAGPAILQAYVYYNTGNERRAAALLDLADKRTEGKDAFVALLKQNWTLPAAGEADQNK